jgi:hypothetical protein
MTDQANPTPALRRLLAAGHLPAKAEATARQLCDRLDKPVRVTLLGKKAVGKSTLRDFLAGAPVLPDRLRLPTLELSYADQAGVTCTLPDGSTRIMAGDDLAAVAALSPVFVQLRLPLPSLQRITILDIAGPDDTTALHRASRWAATRSDIILWCSDNFDDGEQAIWATMPDTIKDHGFLLMTKADILRARDRLDAMLAQAAMVARDEFHQIMAIATPDAIAARRADGSVDKDALRDSGGLALIGALLKVVDQGKEAARDAAIQLLQHYPPPAAHPAAPVAAPEPPAPIAEPAPPAAKISVYQQALDHITGQCATLAAGPQPAPAAIITAIVAQLEWVCDALHDPTLPADDSLRATQTMAQDAADLAQLMAMEKRDSAAIEAASLLIQVKHELAARLAA